MAGTSHIIRLTSDQIDEACCTGEQLLRILESLEATENYIWFAASADAPGFMKNLADFSGTQPQRVGDFEAVKKKLGSVDQFVWLILLAVPPRLSAFEWQSDYHAEGPVYKNIEPAVLMVRIFDSAYFEISASSKKLLEPLQKFLT